MPLNKGKGYSRRRRWVDVRPNWKERPGMPDSWQGRPAVEE
jgi:hypothetical protein